jgi:hypothetical protein
MSNVRQEAQSEEIDDTVHFSKTNPDKGKLRDFSPRHAMSMPASKSYTKSNPDKEHEVNVKQETLSLPEPRPEGEKPQNTVLSVTDIEVPENKQENASEIGTIDEVNPTGSFAPSVQSKMA